jgi:hypothetical protein
MSKLTAAEEKILQWKKPYYYINWTREDNPECSKFGDGREPCWFRIFRSCAEDREPVSISPPLTNKDAKAKLRQLELLIGKDGNYEYSYNIY